MKILKFIITILLIFVLASCDKETQTNINKSTIDSINNTTDLVNTNPIESENTVMTEKEYPESELIEGNIDYSEMWRPQYHYSPKENWVNDPNGLVYYKGIYHLYYQYNPSSNQNNSNTHWGHATSTDLVNWKEEKIALFPDDLGLMWSGTGAVDYNNDSGFFSDTTEKMGIIIAYSTNTQQIGIAYSLDNGYTFNKVSTINPVIKRPEGIKDFRDPHIFYYPEDKKWKVLVAGGRVQIYESSDLINWSLTTNEPSIYNTECPNLIRMKVVDTDEEKWVLSLGGRKYIVGSFDGIKFKGETSEMIFDEGPDTYAGITFSNDKYRRTIMISWLNSWAYTNPADGKWNGCFSLPVELKLYKYGESYRIIQNPVDEIELLKDKELINIKDKEFDNSINPLSGIRTNQFELNASIDLSKSSSFDLNLCVGDEDKTSIYYLKDSNQLLIDRSASKYGISALKEKNYLYTINLNDLSFKDNNILKLRLFVDKSNLELFINDGYYYFVCRIQPFTSSDKMEIKSDEKIKINSLSVHSLKSIWFNDNDEVQSIHLGDSSDIYLETESIIKRDVYALNINTYSTLKVKILDENIVSADVIDNVLTVKGLKKGETTIKLILGKYYKELKVYVFDKGTSNFESNLGELNPINGTTTITYNNMLFETNSGDAFLLSSINANNFSFETEVELLSNGAAALLFNASLDLNNFYVANIDSTNNVVKLWGKVDGIVKEFIAKSIKIENSHKYVLKVIMENHNIKVYLDNELLIDINNYEIDSGLLGLNGWNTSAKFNHIKYELLDIDR